MTDRIRVDKLTVVRAPVIGDRHPVQMNADGSLEVREPTPLAFPMVAAALPASQTNRGANHAYSTSGVGSMLLPRDSRLVGLSVACVTTITAGTLIVKPSRSGVSVPGASLSFGVGDQRKTQWWGFGAGMTFAAATDTIGINTDTDAAWVAQNVVFQLFFAMQP